MSDMKRIRELAKEMEDLDLRRVTIRNKDGSELTIERGGVVHAVPPPMVAAPTLGKVVASSGTEGTFITSPMVGTFYDAPGPDDPPFIKVGDRVSADTVVCIVEAMKVMNEVKAGVNGVIVERLVDNMDAVEFSTQLFRVE